MAAKTRRGSGRRRGASTRSAHQAACLGKAAPLRRECHPRRTAAGCAHRRHRRAGCCGLANPNLHPRDHIPPAASGDEGGELACTTSSPPLAAGGGAAPRPRECGAARRRAVPLLWHAVAPASRHPTRRRPRGGRHRGRGRERAAGSDREAPDGGGQGACGDNHQEDD